MSDISRPIKASQVTPAADISLINHNVCGNLVKNAHRHVLQVTRHGKSSLPKTLSILCVRHFQPKNMTAVNSVEQSPS